MQIESKKLILPGIVISVLVLTTLIIVLVLGQKMSRSFVLPKTDPVSVSAEYANQALRNYYVKSSYNSCASGDYENDFVTLDALSNAIRWGCRFLDFEIYDLDEEPVVGVSNEKNYNFKGSYNSIPLKDVLDVVKTEALTVSDPLFLQFRIKCSHAFLSSKIAKMLSDKFNDSLLGSEYSYKGGSTGNLDESLAAVPLSAFIGKVVIIVDESNKVVNQSSLAEYVNMGDRYSYRSMSNTDLTYNAPNDIVQYTTSALLLCYPDEKKPDNYNSNVAFQQGAQFIAMRFQQYDQNLKNYLARFDNYSFLLKPTDLKYVPNLVKAAGDLPKTMNSNNIVSMFNAGVNTVVTETTNLSRSVF